MIAMISSTEGVCMDGRWKGWLFRKHPDGQFVSVRKLDEVDPMELIQRTSLFGRIPVMEKSNAGN